MTIRALLFIDFCLKHLESLQTPLNLGFQMISDCNLTITPKVVLSQLFCTKTVSKGYKTDELTKWQVSALTESTKYPLCINWHRV